MPPDSLNAPPRRRRRLALATLSACALLGSASTRADDEVPAPNPSQARLTYALGAALLAAPTYAGSGGQQVKLRPLWGVRYGRFRISGARASGLLAAPARAPAPT